MTIADQVTSFSKMLPSSVYNPFLFIDDRSDVGRAGCWRCGRRAERQPKRRFILAAIDGGEHPDPVVAVGFYSFEKDRTYPVLMVMRRLTADRIEWISVVFTPKR
jgi:hypothetical protein